MHISVFSSDRKLLLDTYITHHVNRENFFKEVGDIVDVRLASDPDGRSKGYGHVEFASPEAAQKVKSCAILCFWSRYPWVLELRIFYRWVVWNV